MIRFFIIIRQNSKNKKICFPCNAHEGQEVTQCLHLRHESSCHIWASSELINQSNRLASPIALQEQTSLTIITIVFFGKFDVVFLISRRRLVNVSWWPCLQPEPRQLNDWNNYILSWKKACFYLNWWPIVPRRRTVVWKRQPWYVSSSWGFLNRTIVALLEEPRCGKWVHSWNVQPF